VCVATVSNMQHKRCSIFTTNERGNAKIELLSPRCIVTVPQQSLPGTLLASEADATWSGETRPPTHDRTTGRRPSTCA
jgi:hypothetical protein